MSFEQSMAEASVGCSSEKMARMPTMKERIDLAVRQAEERLAAAKEAQEIFARNPDMEKLIDAIQRGGF